MKIYKIGGCVRDLLLGITPNDTDYLVVGTTADQMQALGYKQVGKDFPVFLHPETHDEYALARTERKTGTGYNGFSVSFGPEVTLEEDLRRRDLTINAIAIDEAGNIVDPLNAKNDIDNKVLRHVSDAFVEDPVRVLRLAKFYARYYHLGFTVASETLELVKEIAAGFELVSLTKERVTKELYSALGTKNPEKFFELLQSAGALRHIMPELDRLWGIPQPELYHPEIDTGVHIMMALKEVSKYTTDVSTRLAVVLHDLGKGVTPSDKWPAHHGHEELGVNVITEMATRLDFPKEDRSLCQLVSRYHLHMHRLDTLQASTIVKMMAAIDVYRKPARIEQFALACKADACGRLGKENIPYPNAQAFIEMAHALRNIDKSDILARKSVLGGYGIENLIQERRVHTIKKYKTDKR